MTPSGGAPPNWLIAGVPDSGSSGGPIRARHVFSALAERTSGRVISAHGRRGLPSLGLALGSGSGGWRRPLRLASTQFLPRVGLGLVRRSVRAVALDVHDHPVLQADGLGFSLPATDRQALGDLFAANVASFERLIVPSSMFAELCGLSPERVIVVSNGTDTRLVTPRRHPDEPVVGMVSGAAPGRGIELLVGAMAHVRAEEPAATLHLALAPTGPASAAYLDALRSDLDRHPWVSIDAVPYTALGRFLGAAAVLVIPHPPNAYLDAATPVKLFDSMAAGRPVVVTPRLETAAIVRMSEAGVVTESDQVDDLGAAILSLLRDERRRRELGENARRAAVDRYDWQVLANGLADVLVAPGAPAG